MNRALTLEFAAAALLTASLIGCDKPAPPPPPAVMPAPPAQVAPPPVAAPAEVKQEVKADQPDKNPSGTPEVAAPQMKQAPDELKEKEATKVDPKLKDKLPGGKELPKLVPNVEAPAAEPARAAVPGGVRQGGRVPAMLEQAADAGR